ncbi:hypothetical protein AB9E29_25545 [Rhizobium leguminosarum]|nr:hypothetical protein [Rhizobium leguminosarum]MBY5398092.1 hypothetical protein [Rhizobium leguminosarum]
MHEADEPNAVINLLDVEPLAGHDCEDIDLLAVHADAAAIGHQYVTLVEADLCLAPMNGRRGAQFASGGGPHPQLTNLPHPLVSNLLTISWLY